MFQENCLCTHLLCTSKIVFTDYWRETQYMSIKLYISLWLNLAVLFQEQMFITATFNSEQYGSTFCSMYLVTFVTFSSLTESVLIAMLFPFCCHVSTTCKHLWFPIIPKFKEIYNETLTKRINFCIILKDQDKHSENINKSFFSQRSEECSW